MICHTTFPERIGEIDVLTTTLGKLTAHISDAARQEAAIALLATRSVLFDNPDAGFTLQS